MDFRPKKLAYSAPFSHVAEKKENLRLDLASLELLKVYGGKVKRLNKETQPSLREQFVNSNLQYNAGSVISAASIMKIAKSRLLHENFQNDSLNILSPLDLDSGLPSDVLDDIELAQLLQASAGKFADKQYDHAWELLSMCYHSASVTGSPVQRIIYYFAEGLEERIAKETGTNLSEGLIGKKRKAIDAELTLMSMQSTAIACQQALPFNQVTDFAGVQAILDAVASAKRVHLVDFGIRFGSHWTIIMHALAVRYECPLELLKITAVGTSQQRLDETGKWLSSFAETMKIPFSYSIVHSDLKDLKEDCFKLEPGEVVAVYAIHRFWSIAAWPNHLEYFIRKIKSLNPCIMVVIETEANTNTSNFRERFDELLFQCCGLFDSLDACMERDNQYRSVSEGVYIRQMIQNVIVAEGEERIHRYQKIKTWRDLFEKFGIVETELSESSLYQANLVLKRSARWSDCTLNMDGKCLIIEWKGAPVQSLSAWTFLRERKVKQHQHELGISLG